MKSFITSLLVLIACSLSAQNLYTAPSLEMPKTPAICFNQTGMPAHFQPAKVDLKLNNQLKTGKVLLITAGCMTAVGIASYFSAWTMVSDATSIGGVFSIGGIALVGASIPLYIAGSVLYVKGKKSLEMTQNGLTYKF